MTKTYGWNLNRDVNHLALDRILNSRKAMLFSAGMIAATDQFLKHLIEQFPVGYTVISISPLFDIVHTANSGAAFSMLSEKILLLLVLTTVMLLLLSGVILLGTRLTNAAKWGMSVLLGGGIGNWIDRVDVGQVTDYIRLRFIRFPVFNFSDICITVAVAFLIALLLIDRLEITGETYGRTDN